MKNAPFLSALIGLSVAAVASARGDAMALPRSTPEAQGISSQAIEAFVEAADRINTMHSFMIVRHGQVLAEGWWKPEAANKPHVLMSLSKSFTSTAVGLAIDEGKLALDDPVLKFFPADAPADPSENLKAMTVHDLLTMTGGHGTEPKIDGAPSVKQFLAHPVVFKPGTHFQYNTMGSYTLSAIITKVTGQTTLEFLKPRLFEPLGIENPQWDSSPEGNSLGGYGLRLCTEDIAKFGQLYLQKGKWNGKQVIPEKWVEQATSKQVSNDQEAHSHIGPDWTQGYGFQFWRCTHNAFRGDGAGGQFCVVIPDEDAVVAITAQTGDMQGELNAIWNNLLPAFKAEALPDDAAEWKKLQEVVANLQAHPAKRTSADSRPPTLCNPMDLPYCFQPDHLGWRVAADPAVVMYKGEYWLFATGSGGYWHSADFIHWKLVTQTNLPLDHDAPGVLVVDGKLYWTAINIGIFETENPAEGNWTLVNKTQSRGDPDLFQDDDGRVYMYDGCSDNGPIEGQELDPKNNFEALSAFTGFFKRDIRHHGAEIVAEASAAPPYRDSGCWIEGPWTTKHDGKYYLQYAAPGTEYSTYSDSVYVSDHPLGPYTYAAYSPFSFKPTGFVTGAGHSTTFQDTNHSYWRVSTMTISVRHKFERRLGVFPTWFTPDGQMVCNTYLGDYPQYPPGTVKDLSRGNSPGWMLLTYNKAATASSTLEGHPVTCAFDEDIRHWWSAETGNPGEWLQVDMGKLDRVDAVQINFGDEGATARSRLTDGYGYKFDISTDGKIWTTIIDRSVDMRDAPHDYVQLDRSVDARYARITNFHMPASAKFSISGLRLFGSGRGNLPTKATNVRVNRDAADQRQATISWDHVAGADGYIVRYGIAVDKLFSDYQVYNADTLHIHTLNLGASYFFAVDTFNDTGVTQGMEITSDHD